VSGWYLRGDVGVGFQNFKSFDHDQTNPAFVWPASWTINQQEIKDATILGFGVGYEFNSWLRFDITGEYRTRVVGKVTGSFKEFCAGGGTCFDSFDFDHSAAVFMANAYLDLGTWWCITPYIGGGVGGAFQRITGLTDVGHNADGTGGFGLTSGDSGAWGLAWNVQAGLQRHQQFQGGLQLALPGARFAADRSRLLPEHAGVPWGLLHAERPLIAGLPDRPPLDAAARAAAHGSPGDDPRLIGSRVGGKTARVTAPFSFVRGRFSRIAFLAKRSAENGRSFPDVSPSQANPPLSTT
jgi:opacity protein-like surface antigen